MSLLETPGYETLLELLREELEHDEKMLLAADRDSTSEQIFRSFAELQGKRKLFARLVSSVKFHAEFAQNPPPHIQKYTNL